MRLSRPGQPLRRRRSAVGIIVTVLLSLTFVVARPVGVGAAETWQTSGIQYTTVLDCTNMNYVEGLGMYSGVILDTATQEPKVGQVFYVAVYVQGLAPLPCANQIFDVQFSLPAGVASAISSTDPILCWYRGTPMSTAQCPQRIDYDSALGRYQYLATDFDNPHAPFWPVPNGASFEFRFPVRSTQPMTNADFVARIEVADGTSSPTLNLRAPMTVYANPTTTTTTSTSSTTTTTAPTTTTTTSSSTTTTTAPTTTTTTAPTTTTSSTTTTTAPTTTTTAPTTTTSTTTTTTAPTTTTTAPTSTTSTSTTAPPTSSSTTTAPPTSTTVPPVSSTPTGPSSTTSVPGGISVPVTRPDVGPAEPADPVDPVDPGGEQGQTTTSLTPEPTDPVDPTEPTQVDPTGTNDSGAPGGTEANDQNGQVQGLEDTRGAIRPVSDDGALPRTGTDQRALWLLGAGTLGLGVLMTGAGRRLAIVRR